ncbi:putative bifunctional diguanylate cyclase/phosphodiesterase [Paenibacillus sp.]|uniref:putative bifunctional diguanylate cyclase/phosphodiesterase n=1 Tax=Paenibacillus sp. TaxID=58172 RepID=UPI002D369B40|nr:EAL domain-containing protein [Paenibacillus sp.]HZG84197.1 EAL domain-containing protein [Paenibacillus sp.]
MQSNSVGPSYFREHALKILLVFAGVFIAAELVQAAATNTAFRPADAWLELAIHLPAAFVGLFLALLALPRDPGAAEAARNGAGEGIDDFARPFEGVPEGIVIYREGAVLYANESARKLFGATSKDELLGRSAEELLNAGRSDRYAAAIDSSAPFLIRDAAFDRFDGSGLHASLLIVPIRIGDRDARMAVLHDIHKKDRMSRELQTVESQLQTIMHNLDVGIWSFDLLGQTMLLVSDRFADMIGARKEDILANPEIWKDVIFPEEGSEADKWFAELLEGRPIAAEVKLPRGAGPIRYGESKIFPYKDDGGRVVRLDGILVDITERALARQRSDFLAFHDELTMLPNRRMFKETLQRLKLNAEEKKRRFAVIYLDMDKFKHINDTYGHANGDLFLKEVAGRLQQAGPEHQHLFRVGGDEFTVILEGVQEREQLENWVHKLMHAFDEPFVVQDDRIPVRGSMGVAVYPDDASDIGVLVNLADRAMFAAKEKGAPYQYYNAAVLEDADDPALLQELKQAVDRRQFVLYFQPKYDVASRTMTGVEALIRWDHPAKGVLPPSAFIPLAEKTGLIADIGAWVVEQACLQIRKWSDKGMPVPISVNVSANQFHEGQIVKAVQDAVGRTGIRPDLLEIEITESVAADFEHAVAVLQQLHGIGVVISVDDFGIGYSSLNYLKKFPIQKLKIDRSFIQDIADQPNDAKIVGTILTLAHALHLTVVAEGVETERQLEVLHRLGCDEAQGFLFSRPVPAEALERIVVEHVRAYKREMTQPGARLKGVFLKNVIGSLLTGKAMFPEYKKLIEEVDPEAYYSWDLYTKMLHDVADKLSPQVVRDVGIRVILSGRDVFMKEQGYDTLEKLLEDYPNMFDRTIVGAPEHERIKYLKYEPGHFVMLYTKRQPKAFNEGVIRGYFKMYDRQIRSLHIEDYDEHYHKIEVTW